jgi:hypothetical protein
MARLPQFSLRYMLAMMFWWSLAFVMFLEVFREAHTPNGMRISYYVLLFPIVLCAALGGLFLKMRTGFVIGVLTSAIMWVITIWAEQRP